MPEPTAALADVRPRVNYTLPDGSVVAIVFDVGELQPAALSYLVGAEIVTAVRA